MLQKYASYLENELGGNDSGNGKKDIEESDDFIWGYDDDNNTYYMGSLNEFKFTSDEVQAKLIVITETEGKGTPVAVEFAEDAEATLGTDWISSGATVTYADQAKTY